MPASGLRSTTNVVLQKTDRFTREFLAIEDEAHPYEPVENIPVTTYKAGPNVPEDSQLMKVLVKLFRMEPEVLVMRDLVDGEAINFACEKIVEGRLIVGTVRAKDCAEAILRVLALKVSAKAFARSVTGVLNQRLIRKLCDACKEAYAPTPQVLQQLGIPPGRVQAFYRPPQEPEKVCEQCGGIGYHGRTALFELMMVDDAVRKLVATGGEDGRDPPGRPKSRHAEPAGRRHRPGGQGRHVVARVDESDETVVGLVSCQLSVTGTVISAYVPDP